MASDPSVDPSFTTITSISESVWLMIESRHWARYCSTLYTGTTIDIFGVIASSMAAISVYLRQKHLGVILTFTFRSCGTLCKHLEHHRSSSGGFFLSIEHDCRGAKSDQRYERQ